MREIFGLFFDPVTGDLFDADGKNTGFRFLNSFETVGFPVNPLNFASKETAEKLAVRIPEILEDILSVKVIEVFQVNSPISKRPFPERILSITTKMGKKTVHNAGLIASSIVRIGWKRAMKSLEAEIALFIDKEKD